MADPIKPMDRLRPFKRINNDAAIPKQAPDGLGVACGCHTPNEFADLEAEFRRFLKARPGALGSFARMIEEAKEIATKAADVVGIAERVATLAAGVAAALGALGGPAAPILAVIAVITTAAKAVSAVLEFVKDLLKAIDTAIHEFFVRIGVRLARRAIRRIPQWVPVEDVPNKQKITVDQIREVEGIVRHSYADPVGVPFFQWQQWLGWSIQVQPEPAYAPLLVPGFAFARDKGASANETPIVDPATFELQWDTGALRVGGQGPGVYGRTVNDKQKEAELIDREPPFFQSNKTDLEPENNWLWPTAGMYVWASGRWVYDCSRTDSLSSGNPKMVSMLNPLRAMATASWEAFGFKENAPGPRPSRNAVPAIRFMFIASKHGGYLDHPSLAESDYEFILDLPPMPVPVSPFPIGHTHAHKRDDGGLPDFPHNTVALRPMLLRDLKRPEASGLKVKLVTPVIEPLPSPKGPDRIEQVKVTVRAGDLAATGSDHAGFLLSLGWFDPNATQADKVKHVEVEFASVQGRLDKERDDAVGTLRELFADELKKVKDEVSKQIDTQIKIPLIPTQSPVSIDELINNKLPEPVHGVVKQIGTLLHDLAHKIVDAVFDAMLDLMGKAVNSLSTEEWMLHFGVNGRWRSRFVNLSKEVEPFRPSKPSVEMFLGPDDALFRSTGGVQWNAVGDIMQLAQSKRMLKRGGDAVVWSQIVAAKGDELRDLMFEYVLDILVGPEDLSLVLGIENDPLGIKQPASLDSESGSNPLQMKLTEVGPAPFDGSSPPFARSVGQEVVLAVEDGVARDYVLTGKVQVGKQFPL
jgi:hypothetical protein